MKLRCELHLQDKIVRVIMAPRPEEKLDHLALKLAAYVMFFPYDPIVEPSQHHASLSMMDVRPDLMGLRYDGDVSLWVECGVVSVRKLDKIIRRLPNARLVVLKRNLREANQLRDALSEEVKNHARIEIWAWPGMEFETWISSLDEKVEVFGEAGEKMFNVVVNQTPIAVNLVEA